MLRVRRWAALYAFAQARRSSASAMAGASASAMEAAAAPPRPPPVVPPSVFAPRLKVVKSFNDRDDVRRAIEALGAALNDAALEKPTKTDSALLLDAVSACRAPAAAHVSDVDSQRQHLQDAQAMYAAARAGNLFELCSSGKVRQRFEDSEKWFASMVASSLRGGAFSEMPPMQALPPSPACDAFLADLVRSHKAGVPRAAAAGGAAEAARGRAERALRRKWPSATCTVYGSHRSALAHGASDVDVCACIDDANTRSNDAALQRIRALERDLDEEADRCENDDCDDDDEAAFIVHSRGIDAAAARDELKALRKQHKSSTATVVNGVRRALDRAGQFRGLSAVAYARVPVVKCTDSSTGLAMDVTVNNLLGVENSQLVGAYAAIDDRARMLLFLVKCWAKANGVGDAAAGTPSSYAHAILAVATLQRHGIVPNLQAGADEKLVSGANVGFDRSAKHAPAPASLSVTHLLAKHFRFLASELDAQTQCVSVKRGGLVPKANWFALQPRNGRRCPNGWRLCIEDPFEAMESPRPRDLGDVLTEEGQAKLVNELRRAAECVEKAMETHDADLLLAIFKRPKEAPQTGRQAQPYARRGEENWRAPPRADAPQPPRAQQPPQPPRAAAAAAAAAAPRNTPAAQPRNGTAAPPRNTAPAPTRGASVAGPPRNTAAAPPRNTAAGPPGFTGAPRKSTAHNAGASATSTNRNAAARPPPPPVAKASAQQAIKAIQKSTPKSIPRPPPASASATPRAETGAPRQRANGNKKNKPNLQPQN